jgi:hypothetical protein
MMMNAMIPSRVQNYVGGVRDLRHDTVKLENGCLANDQGLAL